MSEVEARTRDSVARPLAPRKLIGSVLFSLLVILVLGAAFIYAGLQFSGVRFYKIQSPSMEPAFGAGDVVGVKAVEPYKVKVGDVIVFLSPTRREPVVHRVVRIKSDPDLQAVFQNEDGKWLGESWTYSPRTYYTKGDGNNAEDPDPVEQAALLGRQEFVVPWPFNLLAAALDRSSLFFLGSVLVAAFIVLEVADGVRAWTRNRKPKGAGQPA